MQEAQFCGDIIYIRREENILQNKNDLSENNLYVCESGDVARKLNASGYPAVGVIHNNATVSDSFSEFSGVKYLVSDVDDMEKADYEHFYCRLRHIPCRILETDRLIIKEMTVEDLDELRILYSDPEITRYMEDLFDEEEEKEYQRNYIENVYGFYDIGIWALFLKQKDGSQGKLVGRMGIEMTDSAGVAELGFMLGMKYQHCGLAFEAGQAILDYAKTVSGIETVRARVHPDNFASNRLCEKLGMSAIGIFDNMQTWIYEII